MSSRVAHYVPDEHIIYRRGYLRNDVDHSPVIRDCSDRVIGGVFALKSQASLKIRD